MALLLATLAARAEALSEYRLKAAFLLNFASFTEWPVAVGEELHLCVYGHDPFGADLDKLHGRQVGSRRLGVSRARRMDDLSSCQIVFITREAIGNLDRVVDLAHGRPVLTIADSPGATPQGVILNIVSKEGKLGFEANLAAAQGNHLTLSSKLLRLAREVRR